MEDPMNRRTFVKTLPALAVLAGAKSTFAQEPQPIALPKPQKDGGKSVLAALWERRTNRNVSAEKLPPQVLSNLLWAAFGVNREGGPFGQIGRTAASASNSQEIDLYVAPARGSFPLRGGWSPTDSRRQRRPAREGRWSRSRGRRRQRPGEPRLRRRYRQVRQGEASGAGPAGPGDPEGLLLRGDGADCRQRLRVRGVAGLAAWFHNCNKPALAAELKLRPDQRVLFAQTVGYPAKR